MKQFHDINSELSPSPIWPSMQNLKPFPRGQYHYQGLTPLRVQDFNSFAAFRSCFTDCHTIHSCFALQIKLFLLLSSPPPSQFVNI